MTSRPSSSMRQRTQNGSNSTTLAAPGPSEGMAPIRDSDRSRKRAWLSSRPAFSARWAATPPAIPKTIEDAKKKSAKDQPNNPAETNNSSGEVSGEATMKATIGAHGTELASIERTTAVVPHEQKGVPTAAATAPPTATGVRGGVADRRSGRCRRIA